MLKVLELFGGINATSKALTNLSVEHETTTVEFDPRIIKISNILNGRSDKPLDIREFHATKEQYDLVVGGFPCFVGSTLINTENGFKQIKDIKKGDTVLTHKNRFKKVLKVWSEGEKEIWNITTSFTHGIKTTSNHPFLVLRNNEEQWIQTKDLLVTDFLIQNINQKSDKLDNKYDENFFFLMGLYLGDGYLQERLNRNNSKPFQKLILGINEEKFNKIKNRIIYHYTWDKIGHKMIFSNHWLATEAYNLFGNYSDKKYISQKVLNLDIKYLKKLLEGYILTDGHIDTKRNVVSVTSVSKKLIYGIGQMIVKVENIPFSISKVITLNKTIIEGRTVNQKNYYKISWKNNGNHNIKIHFIKNEKLYSRIRKITKLDSPEVVYNLEVKKDNTYCVNNIIVHNCQPFSNAGIGGGFHDKQGRGDLYLEALRVIDESRPTYVILENVKGILSAKHIWIVEEIKETLISWGYDVVVKLINAKDFIPQNRERVFILASKKQLLVLDSPKERTTVLRDYLDEIVDESYYMKDFQVNNLKADYDKIDKGDRNKIINIGNHVASGHNAGNVYSVEGIAPTVMENHGSSTKIIIKDEAIVKIMNWKKLNGMSEEEKLKYLLSKRHIVDREFSTFKTANYVTGQESDYIYTLTAKGVSSEQKITEKQRYLLINKDGVDRQGDRYIKDTTDHMSTLIAGSPYKIAEKIIVPLKDNVLELLIEKDDNLWFKLSNGSLRRIGFREKQGNWLIPISRHYGSNIVGDADGIINTITTSQPPVIIEYYRLRKLTQFEALRLMGWDEDSIGLIKNLPKSLVYKSAGNSMVVQVMEHTLKMLGLGNEKKY